MEAAVSSMRGSADTQEWAVDQSQEAKGTNWLQRFLVAGVALSVLLSVAGSSPAQAFITGVRPTDNKPTDKEELVSKVDKFSVNYQNVVKVLQPDKDPVNQPKYREMRNGGGANQTQS